MQFILPPKLDINLEDVARKMVDALNESVGVANDFFFRNGCLKKDKRGTKRYQFQCERVYDTSYIFIRRRTNKKLWKRWIKICHFSDRFPMLIYEDVVESEKFILNGFNGELAHDWWRRGNEKAMP